jgi:Uma2 family endonuclease
MVTQSKHSTTVEEYLEAEETALDRHEYLDGEVFAMAGASPRHGQIAVNILLEIGLQLRGSPCRVRNVDTRVATSSSGLYSYADVVVTCKPEKFDGDTLLNPVIIIEVLSPSTGDYDRGAKFERYRQISSFREYLIVAQDRVYVEHHLRTGAPGEWVWTMREFTAPDDVIAFRAADIQLPCSAIYADVELESDLTPTI